MDIPSPLRSPLSMPDIKKVKISSPKHTPDAEYLLRRRGGMAESLEETAKPTLDTVWLKSRNSTDDDRKSNNPFVLPMDRNIFKKREIESVIKQQEKKFFSSLPTQMKSTYLSRLRCRSAPMRSAVQDTIAEPEKCSREKTTWATVVTKSCSQERENIRDYLSKQREKFMLQYSLSVKQDTIKKLEKDTVIELQLIRHAEKHLQQDSVAFEKFIKENDQSSVEAVKLAEKETMLKMEKTAEIKKVTVQMMAMKSDISKYQEILKEYQTYKTFLMAVGPMEWREEQKRKREDRRATKQKENSNIFCLPSSVKDENKKGPAYARRNSRVTKNAQIRHQSKSGKVSSILHHQERQGSTIPEVPETAETSDSDEEPELCYSNPRDMLNLLTDLEEQNLSYIQNFQETEEVMDEIRKTIQLTQERMNSEARILLQQVDILKNTIQREEEKTSELELKSRIFSYGEYRADKQDVMLNVLHKKVKEVYRVCVGEVDSNISTLHMLANIESRMQDVMDRLETLPPDNIDTVRTQREKEKRLKMREEKLLMKKHHQEERLRMALERATSDSKKRTGRRLMPRSEPSEIKKKDKTHALTTREQEDALYFFA
ncbi:coiled-coil domain-containing protein 38 [Oncorhynchus tshawytscha]|uniref:coiled-coil domain-containing protein 38 n=1 Tax=Oncorhynchus tshawytscha TaxID=74940 RepID=UPI000D0A20DD|nr:coiled-coil domain-containing protein 38 [Oncorhynchus tshawytscha]